MEIEYRLLKAEDCEMVLEVTDEGVNNEAEYHDYIRELLGELGENTVGVIALADDDVAGVAICEKGLKLTAGREDFFPEIRRENGDDAIWSSAILAVKKAYRKQNIGSTLATKVFAAIRKQGGKHLLLEIWVHPQGYAPAEGTLALAPSYTDYGVIDDFYQVPALADHVCEICGSPCHCKARIAVLHLFPEITYGLAEKSDCEAVLALTANYIDASAAYRQYIESIHDGLGSESLEMLAFCDQKLIGLASVRAEMHLTGERQDFFEEIRRDTQGTTVWSYVMITVDPAFQGYDIAKELQSRLNAAVKARGVAYILCEIWCRPDGYMPSRGLLRYGGESYQEYGLVEHFYGDIPKPEGAECQVCGKDCQCKALIAVIKL